MIKVNNNINYITCKLRSTLTQCLIDLDRVRHNHPEINNEQFGHIFNLQESIKELLIDKALLDTKAYNEYYEEERHFDVD